MRNASRDSAHHTFKESSECWGAHSSSTLGMERVSLEIYIATSLISRGKEPVSV